MQTQAVCTRGDFEQWGDFENFGQKFSDTQLFM